MCPSQCKAMACDMMARTAYLLTRNPCEAIINIAMHAAMTPNLPLPCKTSCAWGNSARMDLPGQPASARGVLRV